MQELLTGKQKRYLRSLANRMDPILQVGKSGISENLVCQLDDALPQGTGENTCVAPGSFKCW